MVPVQAASPRRRIFYLDLIRALATMLIVLTHFNNPFLADGRYLLTNEPFGIYVGAVGVSLFLVVSGASLAVTYSSPLNLREFYWKRFKGIYPMFWIAWIAGTMYFFVTSKGFPMNNAPVKSLVWTVLGVDGLVANFNVTTAYLLGEWFLGFIILFYLVFPALLWAIERAPVITGIVILLVYGACLYTFRDGAPVPSSVLLPVRLPELAFGIYVVRYARRIHPLTLIPAGAALVVSALLPTQLPEDLATTAVGISCFVIIAVLARYVSIAPVRASVAWVARYSYPVFLVHHVVIYDLFFFSGMDTSSFYPVQLYTLFAVVCAITFALSIALERVTKAVVGGFARAFSGRWWALEGR